jgi:beta-lactamase class A
MAATTRIRRRTGSAARSRRPRRSVRKRRGGAPGALRARIQRIAARLDGTMGVYVHHLARGETVEFNADRPFQMASVFKIPLLAELTAQVAAGARSLDDQLTLTDEMKAPGSGVLKELSPGTRFTVRDLAMLMIIVSDNTATDILLDLVGRDAVNARLAAFGLTHTVVTMSCRDLLRDLVGLSGAPDTPETRRLAAERLKRRELDWNCRAYRDPRANMTTPREMGRLLEQVVRPTLNGDAGAALPAAACRMMLDFMRRQQVRDRLPLLLPPGVEMAHKTGSLTRVSNDAGVLYTPAGPCIVSVFTRDLADDLKGRLAIAQVGRAIYDTYAG